MTTHPSDAPASDLLPLLAQIRACRQCVAALPHPPRPIVQANSHARLLIIGQAPGPNGQRSGLPWSDRSGDRLRLWLGLDRPAFYESGLVATIGMGLCYPGTGRNGDLPPRPECAPLWHPQLIQALPQVELTLLVGAYAQQAYLGKGPTLTENVLNWRKHLPAYLPLPHPSPRNLAWFKRNPWFEAELVPWLQTRISQIYSPPTTHKSA